VVADGGLTAPEGGEELTRADLAGGCDEAQQAQPHGVGERGEDVGEVGGFAVTQWSLEQRGTASVDAGIRHGDLRRSY
jgi:hypothetical protein